MRGICAIFFAILAAGCTNEQLKYNTTDLGGGFGSVMERQVLINLSTFIENPWAIPGHVDVGNGQLQVTDTIGFGLKYPYTAGRNGLNSTKSFTQEFDLNLAQRADQNWWGITPVTDAQDLRRLRALYHYAVCGDWNELVAEWRDTGVDLEAPHRSTLLNPLKSTKQVAAPDKPGASQENANKADASPFNPKSIVPAQPGVKPKAGGGGAGGVPGGSSGADPQYFVKLARNLYKLKGVRWLYWNGTPSDNPVFIEKCPALAQPTVPPYAVSLGVYGGRELWTSDPELFSDFILAVLASIPNTVGYPGSTPKATLTPLSVNVH